MFTHTYSYYPERKPILRVFSQRTIKLEKQNAYNISVLHFRIYPNLTLYSNITVFRKTLLHGMHIIWSTTFLSYSLSFRARQTYGMTLEKKEEENKIKEDSMKQSRFIFSLSILSCRTKGYTFTFSVFFQTCFPCVLH